MEFGVEKRKRVQISHGKGEEEKASIINSDLALLMKVENTSGFHGVHVSCMGNRLKDSDVADVGNFSACETQETWV